MSTVALQYRECHTQRRAWECVSTPMHINKPQGDVNTSPGADIWASPEDIYIFFVVVCFLIYLEQLLWERESQMYEELQSVSEGTNSVIGPSHFSGHSLKVVCTLDKSSELQKILIPVTHNHRPWFDWSGVWTGHIIWSSNPTSV